MTPSMTMLLLTLMQLFHRQHPMIETSMFGAEFVSMKNGLETLHGIRDKLVMMGVRVNDHLYVLGDNMSIIYNNKNPKSTLKKYSNKVFYKTVRYIIAMDESLMDHIMSNDNVADLLTNVL